MTALCADRGRSLRLRHTVDLEREVDGLAICHALTYSMRLAGAFTAEMVRR